MINSEQLSKIGCGSFLQLNEHETIELLITDTRKISDGRKAMFFAINGKNHDGHKYLEQAYKLGVRFLIVERSIDVTHFPKATIFQTANSITLLQTIVALHRAKFNYPVIGITGSNGKTIVKEWLATMMANHQSVVKSPKSYNSQIGVPLSVWQMLPTHKLGIFEAGISEKGEMEAIASVIKPTIGILTNIGSAHDEGFSTREEKLYEKIKLFESCQKIIYCADKVDIHGVMLKNFSPSRLCGWSTTAGLAKYDVTYERNHLTINDQSEHFKIKTSLLLNAASRENITHCVITMHLLGLSSAEIQAEVATLKPVKMRLELKAGNHQCYIIDDTYNNDLVGLEVALDYLRQQNQYPKKTLILSDILQSGLDKEALYSKVATLVKQRDIHRMITIGEDIPTINSYLDLPTEHFATTELFLKSMPSFHKEMILVKGNRNMEFERIVLALQQKIHGTVLEINLEALVHNLNYYKSQLSKNTKVMVMVKAVAYGGGSKEIAQTLQFHRVDYLGVAYIDEAIELRNSGIDLPILVLNPMVESFHLFLEYNLEPELYSMAMLDDFINVFEGKENAPSVQLKFDTGMHRLGFEENEIVELTEKIKQANIKVSAVMTHLAASDSPSHDDFSKKQFAIFDRMAATLVEDLGYFPLRHVLNSSGILRFPDQHYEMVRLGIGLYGYENDAESRQNLKNVGTLKTTISQIKKIAKGDTVGYNRSWMAARDSRIATIAIGYADGFSRDYSNGRGFVAIAGKLCPVVGNVCMDMAMVDVTDCECSIADEVIVFGEYPTIVDLAEWQKTIPYEIITSVSDRVRRIYLSE
jgi:alanine racemase